jgi:NAD dependent epimerase/dehydratase family enzyme
VSPDRIVIAGASGFVGTYLACAFRAEGATVLTIGRERSDAQWGDSLAIARLLEGADVLINLAGKSVNCRYNRSNREEILRSRVDTTNELAAAIAQCEAAPPLWLNSSTATIYRDARDRPMTESTGELGSGFSVGVARAWEAAFFEAETPATRKVALRMAIVLGDGSALVPLVRLARSGLGGPQLDGWWWATRKRREAGTFHERSATGGLQKFSWVHIIDVLGVIRFVRAHSEIDGVINVSAPNPSDNATLMRTIRRVIRAPFGLPAPRILLELGSALICTETELVLKSRWVVPERLMAAGYEFVHPELEPALREILHASE